MRIISQNGYMDVPYEYLGISNGHNGDKTKFIICGHYMFGEPKKALILATYSTEENAIKAMQMLRETYAPHIDLKLSDEQKSDLKKLGAFKLEPMQNTDVEYMNFENYYFQFPKDEEIEV